MPVVVLFDGIKLEMYFNDHAPPHIHVKYAEYEVVLTIQEAGVLAGFLPVKQLKQAQQYIIANQEKLLERWEQYAQK